MLPKPKHLGPIYAAQFRDQSVVDAYQHRPPYPDEVIDLLTTLIVDEPRAVLDAGCGRGEVARRLVDRVDRVDAVDPSAAMIEQGKRLPNGDHPNLTWIEAAIEDAPLRPPYALVTAGQSLHWMEWAVTLPRFRDVLTLHGSLALVGQRETPVPWHEELMRSITRYSTNREYQSYDLVAELETRGLFEKVGEVQTAPLPFRQSIDGYIESFHARDGLSRQRMDPDSAAAFDADVRAMVTAHTGGEVVELSIVGAVVWGRPLSPANA